MRVTSWEKNENSGLLVCAPPFTVSLRRGKVYRPVLFTLKGVRSLASVSSSAQSITSLTSAPSSVQPSGCHQSGVSIQYQSVCN